MRDWFHAAYGKLLGPGLLAKERAQTDSDELLAILAGPACHAGHIRELCTNPLLLTILCIVFHEVRMLPTECRRVVRPSGPPPLPLACRSRIPSGRWIGGGEPPGTRHTASKSRLLPTAVPNPNTRPIWSGLLVRKVEAGCSSPS